MDEVLKYAIENGIIDLSRIQDEIEMTKREELLKKHPYSIWESKDGKWHTYLPDEEKRVSRKRKTKKEIEDLIIEYWKQQEKFLKNGLKISWNLRKSKKEVLTDMKQILFAFLKNLDLQTGE